MISDRDIMELGIVLWVEILVHMLLMKLNTIFIST